MPQATMRRLSANPTGALKIAASCNSKFPATIDARPTAARAESAATADHLLREQQQAVTAT
jgi:hypothetical protein